MRYMDGIKIIKFLKQLNFKVMSKKCFITKLKMSVTNPDLPTLNGIQFKKTTGNSHIDFSAVDRAHEFSAIVHGDYVANYNVNYQNETFKVLAPLNQLASVIITSAANNGYFEFVFDDTMVYDKVVFAPHFLECQETFADLCEYSPYFLINLLQQGSKYKGTPKFSEWLNLVDENTDLIANLIQNINTYETNVEEDTIDYAKLGKLIKVTNIINLNTIVPATVATAMVSNGRTSGTMRIITNVVVTIKFGSSMTNPTAEETAQGYQIS